jgi:hypothetical protein
VSDISQGRGWWLAPDGKWYPPEAHPPAPTSTRATWSVILPVIGWFFQIVPLLVSDHFGNTNNLSGIQESTNAGVGAFLVSGFSDWLFAASAIFLAVSAKRKIRTSGGTLTGRGMTNLGLVLATILILAGAVSLLIGLFIKGLGGVDF